MVALFAILAGLGETVVGFTGNYLGILSTSIQPAFSTALIGAFYSLGGLSLLITRKKWGAAFSIISIGAEILGCVYLRRDRHRSLRRTRCIQNCRWEQSRSPLSSISDRNGSVSFEYGGMRTFRTPMGVSQAGVSFQCLCGASLLLTRTSDRQFTQLSGFEGGFSLWSRT
jgi:hypothetical protein